MVCGFNSTRPRHHLRKHVPIRTCAKGRGKRNMFRLSAAACLAAAPGLFEIAPIDDALAQFRPSCSVRISRSSTCTPSASARLRQQELRQFFILPWLPRATVFFDWEGREPTTGGQLGVSRPLLLYARSTLPLISAAAAEAGRWIRCSVGGVRAEQIHQTGHT